VVLRSLRNEFFRILLERIATEQPSFFAPDHQFFGRVIRNEFPIGHLVVYLSPELLGCPQEDIEGTIAHEFAHVVRQYQDVDSVRTENELASDLADEKAADVLAQSWGFLVPRSLP
jgi:hypothetical protein